VAQLVAGHRLDGLADPLLEVLVERALELGEELRRPVALDVDLGDAEVLARLAARAPQPGARGLAPEPLAQAIAEDDGDEDERGRGEGEPVPAAAVEERRGPAGEGLGAVDHA